MNRKRREFLRGAAVLAGALLLPEGVLATPGDGSSAPQLLDATLPEGVKATEDNIQGPFYRKLAPFRAKVTPPLEAGTVLLITGRVWALDTRKPLEAVIDIWQANAAGRYDNDDRKNPPDPEVFVNRARLRTDEQGRYEFESIHPGAYKDGSMWRPPHIHYRVQAAGYRTLITQLYFEGDPHQAGDAFIKKELIIKLEKQKKGEAEYERGVFDIVLAK
jgi:protocatechuate 3,4-dioxygenase beta subunit